MTKTYIKKVWLIVRESDMDICEKIFETERKAYQYRNDTLRYLMKSWPTTGKKHKKLTDSVFQKFMSNYKVKRAEISYQ